MYAMRYQVTLPADYDMKIIKERVKENGYKTDGFQDLLFKAYLIQETSQQSIQNSYAPLYIWKESEGMTKFIFEGYYDNILQSFGWHSIEIGITAQIDLSPHFEQSGYLAEKYIDILPGKTLTEVMLSRKRKSDELGVVAIYNPDKWKLVEYTFLAEKPIETDQTIYKILHLSMGVEKNNGPS